ncbi:MAG: TRAP transporter fused permease subunit [Chloroflexota bacterium]
MLARIMRYLFPGLVIASFIYHMVYVMFPMYSSTEHLNTHLAFAFLLVYLAAIKEKLGRWKIILPLIVLALVATVYVFLLYNDIQFRYGRLTLADTIIAIILIVLVIDASWRAMGPVIPIVSIIFILYALYGSYLPPSPFRIAKLDFDEVVSVLTFQFSGRGIYGVLLEVSAYFIFLFAVMGGLMQVTGAPLFFKNMGVMVGRKLQGGPALMAVVGSALMGMVTGVATANVIVTGSFTIPLMKRVGYAPKEAGAIEAAASNGGQIMPPVMGATAFVMAVISGIKYVVIMVAAVIPAILYFLSVGIYVQFLAMKKKIMPMSSLGEKADYRQMWYSLPAFAVPLAVIIFLFLKGFSPMYVAFWAALASVVMAFIKPGQRLSWSQLLEGLTSGIMAGATIAMTIAPMGIIVAVLTITGLGVKLPGIVEVLSGGNLGIALVLVMVTCIILGMGVPTTPAYILVAIVVSPVLTKMGVSILATHFFIFYFACMSLLTPPVAPAAIIASKLAGASYTSTAIEASKAAVVGFLVPFIFVMNPIFLLQPGENLLNGIIALIAGLVMVVAVAIGFVGYYFTRLTMLERALFLLTTLSCFIYLIVLKNYLVLGGAVALFVLLTLYQIRHWRRIRVAAAV